jgi:hypothetical protein
VTHTATAALFDTALIGARLALLRVLPALLLLTGAKRCGALANA